MPLNDSRDTRRPRRWSFGRRRNPNEPGFARGGFSLAAVLTGVVVAFGAMFLLSALVGGVLAATGVEGSDITSNETREATVGAGIALVIALFLSYLWGGYAAGRMSRGAGFVNGLLVPVLALIVAAIVGAVVNALGAAANLNLPFAENQLPVEGGNLIDFGEVVGVASIIGMFVGGILGGLLGSGWHSKLERRTLDEREAEAEEKRREVVLEKERDRSERDQERAEAERDRERIEAERDRDRAEAERDRVEDERRDRVDERDAPGRVVATERRPAAAPPPPTETERRA
jgi:hypothetical protein